MKNLADRVEEYMNDKYIQYLFNMKKEALEWDVPKYLIKDDKVYFHEHSERVKKLLDLVEVAFDDYKKRKYPDLFDELMLNKEGR
jgi:hypothetical protein